MFDCRNRSAAPRFLTFSVLLFAAGLLSICLLSATTLADKPASDDASEAPSMEAVPKPEPVPMPEADKIERAMDRGIQFLLDDQNENGSWGTPERTKNLNIYAPVPGAHHAFRTAVTALCLSSLIEMESDRADIQRAIDRGEAWMMEHLPELRRATPAAIYNVWGHGYAIQALVRMRERHADEPDKQERITELIRLQYDYLDRYETVDGGWGYYDFDVGAKTPAGSTTSFVSAAVLVAFDEARDIGVSPPEKLTQRAIDSILRQQKPDFSYLYGEYLKYRPMRGINRPAGSLGRSQACNLALRLWGDERVTDQVLKNWLNRLVARNGWLSIGRKRPIPHESWFQVAGYFYYFGHYYAALCIEQLDEDDQHDFQAHLATILLKLQEKDGSWWDFPLYNYHQQYGTAFALMSLKRCHP
ncbi:MAG: prenyltransferase/squalene oxidase repeat-containing protein [Planctomycetota bacterium]